MNKDDFIYPEKGTVIALKQSIREKQFRLGKRLLSEKAIEESESEYVAVELSVLTIAIEKEKLKHISRYALEETIEDARLYEAIEIKGGNDAVKEG